MKEKNDELYTNFINDLQKLSKKELIDYISDYWFDLKRIAENQMNDNINYHMDEYGRVKMTEVNKLNILLKTKVKYK